MNGKHFHYGKTFFFHIFFSPIFVHQKAKQPFEVYTIHLHNDTPELLRQASVPGLAWVLPALALDFASHFAAVAAASAERDKIHTASWNMPAFRRCGASKRATCELRRGPGSTERERYRTRSFSWFWFDAFPQSQTEKLL